MCNVSDISPVAIQLDRDIWLASARMAGWRTAANEPIRVADRHRGSGKNMLNDLQGCLGELVALRVAEMVWPAKRIVHDALDWSGPQDDVDLVIDNGSLRLEAKCHLDAPGKRLLLVNQRAHERSLKRGAHGYVPVFSAVGRGGAFVGSVIGPDELATWKTWTWDSRPESDPALGISLDVAASRYFRWSWIQMSDRLGRAAVVATETDIRSAYASAFDRPAASLDGGDDVSYAGAISTLLSI